METDQETEVSGPDLLWNWFGLSYASWLTLPRVLMQSMPDDWQLRMAQLLQEYSDTWDIPEADWMETAVSGKKSGKFCKLPKWTSRQMYRHPDRHLIDSFRRKQDDP